MRKIWFAFGIVGFVGLIGLRQASATTLYVTENAATPNGAIVEVDTVAKTVTTVLNTPVSNPDSLFFDSQGRIIWDALGGTVWRYDLNTHSDTMLVSGLTTPYDICLEPGGNSMLVSDSFSNSINRINLTTLAITPLGTVGAYLFPSGLAYDSKGNLFACLGTGVAQLDPTTGAILNQNTTYANADLDGLTYDSFTGKLYAIGAATGALLEFDPTNLASASALETGVFTRPDGLTSDGLGNLFIADYGNNQVDQYNLVTDVLTPENTVPSADDLAPASGLGSAPPPGSIPEPATMTLLGLGLTGLVAKLARRRSR